MISEDLVEDAWMEVGAMPPAKAERAMQRVAKKQRDLIAFVAAYSEDLSESAAELAFYMFFTIHRMFEKAAGGKLQRIRGGRVERCLDQNEQLLGRLDGAHEKFIERVAMVESSRQPFVMRYLVETLMEAPDGEDPVDLTEEEIGVLFLVLKTLIDVLDQSLKRD
ncbi:MAG: hypothetical protein AAF560_01215 [Acidobacteriota bacterium]